MLFNMAGSFDYPDLMQSMMPQKFNNTFTRDRALADGGCDLLKATRAVSCGKYTVQICPLLSIRDNRISHDIHAEFDGKVKAGCRTGSDE
jgi:hypothetical protein